LRTIADLQRLDPHSQGHPPPTLVVRAATVAAVRRVGRANGQGDQPHLQLRLTDARRATWDAIDWRMGERASELAEGTTVSLICRLSTSAWNVYIPPGLIPTTLRICIVVSFVRSRCSSLQVGRFGFWRQ